MSSVFFLRPSAQSIAKSCAALLGAAGWALAGSSDRAADCLPALRQARPTVLACDLRMADGPVDGLVRELRQFGSVGAPSPKILLLTPSTHDKLLFDTLASGAHGYLVEADNGAKTLAAALAATAADRALMSPQIARQTLSAFGLARSRAGLAGMPAIAQDLSPVSANGELQRAEQALLTLLAQGLLPHEIAQAWQLDACEVERRISALYPKLHRLPANASLDLALI